MIIDRWWINVIALIFSIILYICGLLLYLYMNQNQRKEEKNIALLSISSISFGFLFLLLIIDVILDVTKDKRTEKQKNLDNLKDKVKKDNINNTNINKFGNTKR